MVSRASTVCAQRTLGRPCGPSTALKCPHRSGNPTEQALLSLKLCEGGALPAHRKHSESPFICQVPLHPTEQGVYAKDSPGKADPLWRFQLILRQELDTHIHLWWPAEWAGWLCPHHDGQLQPVVALSDVTNFQDKPEVRLFI